MDEMAISWFPDILAIVCIGASTIIIFATVIIGLRKTPARLKIKGSASSDRKYGADHRPLGKMEAVFHHLHKEGCLQVSMAANVKSSKFLDRQDIQKVITHLCQIHPLLRMRLVEKDCHPHFVPVVRPIPFATVTSENWLDIFQNTLEEKLDETEHLWKITKIEKPVDLIDNSDSRDVTFIFTFHHAVGDGLCKTRLITQFFKCLNLVLSNSELIDKKHSLLPPVDHYIDSMLKRSHDEKLLFETLEKEPTNSLLRTAQKRFLCPSGENQFIANVGTPCPKNHFAEPRTVVIPMRFSGAETNDILRTCRARGVTVQGMLTAATSITMKHLLDSSAKNSQETTSVQIRTTVNLRRYLNSAVPDDYMGSYFVGLFGQNVAIENCNSPEEQFWRCAWKHTKSLKEHLNGGNFVTKFWNLLETVYYFNKTPSDAIPKSDTKATTPNRTSEVLSINNYGLCPYGSSEKDFVKLLSCFCAVAEHRKGPIFTMNAVTVEGQLCLSFVYYTNITTTEMAVNFANDVKNKILIHSQIN